MTLLSTEALTGCEQTIAGTYRLGRKIGQGSYGSVHLGTHLSTGQLVAIKLEPNNAKSQLPSEAALYRELKSLKGFPEMYFFGTHADQNVLVLEMLGRNLESVFNYCGRSFSLKSVLFLTLQLLKRFETLHSLGIVYQDVKPENFMLGARTNTVHVIDFGLSRKYLNPTNGSHVPFRKTGELIGTWRYMSINAHLCVELSRRDDLEAVGYVILYFLRGRLPWSGLKVGDFKAQNAAICEMKRSTPVEQLCEGFPVEFTNFLQSARSLLYEEAPNYTALRGIFKRMFRRLHLADDGIYDWNH